VWGPRAITRVNLQPSTSSQGKRETPHKPFSTARNLEGRKNGGTPQIQGGRLAHPGASDAGGHPGGYTGPGSPVGHWACQTWLAHRKPGHATKRNSSGAKPGARARADNSHTPNWCRHHSDPRMHYGAGTGVARGSKQQKGQAFDAAEGKRGQTRDKDLMQCSAGAQSSGMGPGRDTKLSHAGQTKKRGGQGAGKSGELAVHRSREGGTAGGSGESMYKGGDALNPGSQMEEGEGSQARTGGQVSFGGGSRYILQWRLISEGTNIYITRPNAQAGQNNPRPPRQGWAGRRGMYGRQVGGRQHIKAHGTRKRIGWWTGGA